jgi:hypothetical protein
MRHTLVLMTCAALLGAACGDEQLDSAPRDGFDLAQGADMDAAGDMDALDMDEALDLAGEPDLPEPLDLGELDLAMEDMEAPDQAAPMDMGRDMAPDPDPDPPRPPAELMVYTSNIENLPTPSDMCPGDWQDLYAYMATQASKPDLFFLQQVDDQAQLNQIIAFMEQQLKRPYAGVIADPNPAPFRSPCGMKKAKQTNAIIYATDRLRKVDAPISWRSWRNFSGTCRRDGLARTRSVALRLKDRETGDELGVASIHWSTSNSPGPDSACAIANGKETHQKLRQLSPNAKLYIFGGDANEPDRLNTSTLNFTRWYKQLNVKEGGALGYLDPMWEACKAAGGLSACLRDAWTVGSVRRIDFLFTRSRTGPQPKILRAHTISYDEGDAAARQVYGSDVPANYSGHRSVLMRLRY